MFTMSIAVGSSFSSSVYVYIYIYIYTPPSFVCCRINVQLMANKRVILPIPADTPSISSASANQSNPKSGSASAKRCEHSRCQAVGCLALFKQGNAAWNSLHWLHYWALDSYWMHQPGLTEKQTSYANSQESSIFLIITNFIIECGRLLRSQSCTQNQDESRALGRWNLPSYRFWIVSLMSIPQYMVYHGISHSIQVKFNFISALLVLYP